VTDLRVTAVGFGLETLRVGLGVETLDEEPECHRQFKDSSGDQEDEADGDPEDLSDGSRRVKRLADHAQTCQPLGDQPSPVQQPTQEEGPDSERQLGDLIGHGVRLGQE
jgi:hypothetical protein